jgi:hypothetical protein
MLLGEVLELVDDVHSFDTATASLEDSNVALAQVTRLAGWLESLAPRSSIRRDL